MCEAGSSFELCSSCFLYGKTNECPVFSSPPQELACVGQTPEGDGVVRIYNAFSLFRQSLRRPGGGYSPVHAPSLPRLRQLSAPGSGGPCSAIKQNLLRPSQRIATNRQPSPALENKTTNTCPSSAFLSLIYPFFFASLKPSDEGSLVHPIGGHVCSTYGLHANLGGLLCWRRA